MRLTFEHLLGLPAEAALAVLHARCSPPAPPPSRLWQAEPRER